MAEYRDPPRTFFSVLNSLGPGIIIAGSIVGSGELIATTKVGAQAGFWLLWLILVGCAIKVFTQVEIGRYTVTHNRTPLDGLNQVPGPRLKVNWLIWYWAVMTVFIIVQQGGIAGGVGQALAIAWPLSSDGETFNEYQDELVHQRVALALAEQQAQKSPDSVPSENLAALRKKVDVITKAIPDLDRPLDEYAWTMLICFVTSALLLAGNFRFIEWLSAFLVAGFTVVTIITLVLMQMKPQWAVTGPELVQGLSFRLPPSAPGKMPLITALSAFGIIGVGAAELIMYPYWCLEKGYAKYAGANDGSAGWIERAKGWMRVMRIDAWFSMVIYTLATVGFYLLGASVLARVQLDPESQDMVRTLAQMYVPVFGQWAHLVFLLGAIAVLYSTLFVAAAGHSRIVADGLCLFGILHHDEQTRMRWSRIISGIWPIVAGLIYCAVQDPPAMVLLCGIAQMLMLPLLGIAALWFRYRQSIAALRPTFAWDIMLWLSVIGFFIAAVSYFLLKIPQFLL